jgi:hypothetical protein
MTFFIVGPPKTILKNGVITLNPEWVEWKKKHQQDGGNSKNTQQKHHQRQEPAGAPIEKMTVKIQVLQGKDLVAKDRNLLGKKTTSDPYVVVSLLSSRGRKVQLGKTPTIYKNLSPRWDHSVTASVSYLEHGPTLGSNHYRNAPGNSMLVFEIFDEDQFSEPDRMGVVQIPLEWDNARPESGTWYEIPKNSAKNATGSIEIRISSQVHRMENLKPYC